ncbi:MAG: S8 family serine peptidase [Mariprofundus sp.]|nr:S8 family serine peptidase [Mariprofundus sp.]
MKKMKKMKKMILSGLVSVCMGLFLNIGMVGAALPAQGLNAQNGIEYVDQLIVKMRLRPGMATVMNANQMATISGMIGVQLSYVRPMVNQAHVMKLPSRMPVAQAQVLADTLANNPTVEYAEPDRWMHPMRVPNDPRYNEQWHYDASANHGMNLPAAWDISIGSANIVTAVIDTGILPGHADFAGGRLLPGFDMISVTAVANDGDARDADPTDTGDAVTLNECFAIAGFNNPPEPSSWHGTHVAGTVGAATDNAVGVAGVDWTGKILPVRALGKCGGFTSDIVDAMAWAAGIAVTNVANNPNPAHVLNLSLGGAGACGVAQQNIIDQIVALGKVIVVAAGNENANASGFNPANCNGVIAVAAHGPTSLKANYSNFGAKVTVMAPGGAQSFGNNQGVLSTADGGLTAAANDNTFLFYEGTSMASPHVAGLVALMFAVNPALTPAEVTTALQNSVRPFVAAGFCANNPNNCGAGIVDAHAALLAVSQDTVPPVITLLGISPTLVAQGTVYNDAGATATDNVDGNITGNIVTVNPVNTALAGIYIVTYNISDAANNAATQVTRSVRVTATGTTANGTTAQIPLAGGGTVNIVSNNAIISNFSTSATTGTPPAGVSFPFGLVRYSTTVTPGGNQTVNLTYSAALPANLVLFKVNNTGVYTLIPNGTGVNQWVQINANTIALTLVDGGAFDLDATVNGVIVDPVGVGIPAPIATGGGGCVIQPMPSFDPLLPMVLILSLFWLAKRRKFQPVAD